MTATLSKKIERVERSEVVDFDVVDGKLLKGLLPGQKTSLSRKHCRRTQQVMTATLSKKIERVERSEVVDFDVVDGKLLKGLLPDSTVRDLWKVCSDYGTVVDVFIPFKRSKSGKCLAFVRFIKEDDQDDLSSDGDSQKGDVANKADNNESDADRVSESSFMHENDTSHKDVNSSKTREVGSHSEDHFNIYGISNGQKTTFVTLAAMNENSHLDLLQITMIKKKRGENIKDTTERIQSLSNKLNDSCSNCGFSSQRSLGNKAKRSWIKELCQKHRINFAFIQETKAENISLHTIKDLWGNQMFDHVVGSLVSCSGETNYDYGPSPFRFFHSWFAMEGFNYFVETTWKSLNIVEPNDLIQLMKKLQALKIAINAWSKEANKRSNDRKINIQQNLSEVDKLIDQGKSNDEILIKRITLLNDLQELNNRNAMEISQKAKIQWSIEGDEYSKYFHGLKINLYKSKLMGIAVSLNVVAAAASLIGCSILTAPSIIMAWPHFPLKSVLTSILLYHISIFKVPIGLFNHLECIRRNLFYGVDGSDRKLAWIGWDIVLTSKKNGGLAIFGNKGALDTYKLIPRRSPWQDVILAIRSLQSKGINLMDFIQKKFDNGENTSFWDDSWLGEVALKVLYKRWCWSLEGSQEFSVKSSRILIDNTILPKVEVPTRWLRVVPIK
nr:RNA-directed DNA polymerase, eukaryota, reverse transcriptase zinc-binding domain protein [Tanacetum cinerariifolium]